MRLTKFNEMSLLQKKILYDLEMIHYYLLFTSFNTDEDTKYIFNFIRQLLSKQSIEEITKDFTKKDKCLFTKFIITFFRHGTLNQGIEIQNIFNKLDKNIVNILKKSTIKQKQIKLNTTIFNKLLLNINEDFKNQITNKDKTKFEYPIELDDFYVSFDMYFGSNNAIFLKDFNLENILFGHSISYSNFPGFFIKENNKCVVLHNYINYKDMYSIFNCYQTKNYNECHKIYTILHEKYGHGNCSDIPLHYHFFEESYAEMMVIYMMQFDDILKKYSDLNPSEIRKEIWSIIIITHLYDLVNNYNKNPNESKCYSLLTSLLVENKLITIELKDKITIKINFSDINNYVKVVMDNIHYLMKTHNITELNNIFMKHYYIIPPLKPIIMYLYDLKENRYDYTFDTSIDPIVKLKYEDKDDYVLSVNNNAIECYLTMFNELEKNL